MRILLALLIISLSSSVICQKLTVDIYIESLCPYCTQFITNTGKVALYTADIEKIVEINVFPYGNARQSLDSKGTYQFTCQHGVTECYGNLMEVCAMNLIQSNLHKSQYVSCLEENAKGTTTQAFDKANTVCAPQFGLQVAQIQDCMNSQEGNLLQHTVADITNNLVPSHQYVPWIVANGKFDSAVQDQIQNNFLAWACKNYKGSETIAACDSFILEN